MKARRCLYFGGSFDPPHIGHLQMLKSLAEDSWSDQVYVVPTSINPFKQADENNDLWSKPKNRLIWTQLLMKEAAKIVEAPHFSKVELVDREIRYPEKKAYTVDTLKELQAENTNCDLWSLAIGSDLIENLHKWKNIKDLLSAIESVWVFPRDEDKLPLEKLDPSLKGACEYRIMGTKIPSVSSSDIRAALKSDPSGASCGAQIPPQVLESIQNMIS